MSGTHMAPVKLDLHRDRRGFVFEPLSAADLVETRNVHVVVTNPGEIRGNHYHRHLTELVAVTGPALVRVRVGGAVTDFEVPADEVHRFRFEPGVAHAIKVLGDGPGLLVACGDRSFDPAEPDVVAAPILD